MGAREARSQVVHGVQPRLAEGEPPGVDVHAGDADVLEWHGEQEGSLGGDVAEQVRVFLAALEAEGSVVQHLLVLVAGLLHLQPVELRPQPHQLLRQALVRSLHLPLHRETGVRAGAGPAAVPVPRAAGMPGLGWGTNPLDVARDQRRAHGHSPGVGTGSVLGSQPRSAQMPGGLHPHGCCCLRHPKKAPAAVPRRRSPPQPCHRQSGQGG